MIVAAHFERLAGARQLLCGSLEAFLIEPHLVEIPFSIRSILSRSGVIALLQYVYAYSGGRSCENIVRMHTSEKLPSSQRGVALLWPARTTQ
jgi:hypothetical protein